MLEKERLGREFGELSQISPPSVRHPQYGGRVGRRRGVTTAKSSEEHLQLKRQNTANGTGGAITLLINFTAFPFLPAVNLKVAGDQTTVSWGAWNTNYILESSPDPRVGGWKAMTNCIPVAGGVTLTNLWPAQFFRLH
jgi:hypothetical protein